MSTSIRRMLWAAFAALALFVAFGVGLTTAVLQLEKRQEYAVVEESRPLLDSVRLMDQSIVQGISSSRGYLLTHESQFIDQYETAERNFDTAATMASQSASDPRDQQFIAALRRESADIRRLTDTQITYAKENKLDNAREFMLEASRLRRSSPDHAAMLVDHHRITEQRSLADMENFRQWVIAAIILAAIALVAAAAIVVWRIEQALTGSIRRQIRRTEAMIGGMPDGVMLVDRDGRTAFINPAGQRMLARSDLGIPIEKQAAHYGLLNEDGRAIDAKELPAAKALSTGRLVHDATMIVRREGHDVAISVSATPLHEDGEVTGVIVTFRDITERRRLEAETQSQAGRAQILADAGAFFSSNIDPVWVTQAIAERVAEVLGDWSAVILKTQDSKELRVASIYHRDMTSLGMAWSYIYRQPLATGDGMIGQVVASGMPSLTTNVGSAAAGVSGTADTTSYHAPAMQLESSGGVNLETVGAIAATGVDRISTGSLTHGATWMDVGLDVQVRTP